MDSPRDYNFEVIDHDDIHIRTSEVKSFRSEENKYIFTIDCSSNIEIDFENVSEFEKDIEISGASPRIYVMRKTGETVVLKSNNIIDICDPNISGISFYFVNITNECEFIINLKKVKKNDEPMKNSLSDILGQLSISINMSIDMIKHWANYTPTSPVRLNLAEPVKIMTKDEDEEIDIGLAKYITNEFSRIKSSSSLGSDETDDISSIVDTPIEVKPVLVPPLQLGNISPIKSAISPRKPSSPKGVSPRSPRSPGRVLSPRTSYIGRVNAICSHKSSSKVGWGIHHAIKSIGFDGKNKILELGDNPHYIISLLRSAGFKTLYGVCGDKYGYCGYKFHQKSPDVFNVGSLANAVAGFKTKFDVIYTLDYNQNYNIKSIAKWLRKNCKYFITLSPNRSKSHMHNILRKIGFSLHSAYPAFYYKGFTIYIFKN